MTETLATSTENSVDTQGQQDQTQQEFEQNFVANEATDELSSAEKAYFESRGETELPAEDETGAETQNAQRQTANEPPKPTEQMLAQAEAMRNKALEWQRDLANLQGQNQNPAQSFKAQEQTPPPDPREDFLGFARWQGQEITRLQEQMAAQQNQAQEKERHENAENAIMQEWDNAVEETRKTSPDIDEALVFLEDARMNQLGVLGKLDPRFANKEFCQKQLRSELRDIVISTFQQGKNPANAVYEIAKAYGYGRDETARMNKLQEATAGARSLTAGSGQQAGDPYLLETVANMPEAEFEKWYDKNKASFRAMFGG